MLAITMMESKTLISNGLTSMMVSRFVDLSEMSMSKNLHLEVSMTSFFRLKGSSSPENG